MPAHRINLRGPWKLELGTGPSPIAHKIRLPAEWDQVFAGCSGAVRLSRTFHRPTNLEPAEVVELAFEHWPGNWVISLNQRPLSEFREASAESPKRIDVTALLQPTNTVTAEIHLTPQEKGEGPAGQFGNVALEIRRD